MHGLAQVVDGILDAFLALPGAGADRLVAFLEAAEPLAEREIALRLGQRLLHRRLAQVIVAIENREAHHHGIDDQRQPDGIEAGDEIGLDAEGEAGGEERRRNEARRPAEEVEADLAEAGAGGDQTGDDEGEDADRDHQHQQALEQLRVEGPKDDIEREHRGDETEQHAVHDGVVAGRLEECDGEERSEHHDRRAEHYRGHGVETGQHGPKILERCAIGMGDVGEHRQQVHGIGGEDRLAQNGQRQQGQGDHHEDHAVEGEVLGLAETADGGEAPRRLDRHRYPR